MSPTPKYKRRPPPLPRFWYTTLVWDGSTWQARPYTPQKPADTPPLPIPEGVDLAGFPAPRYQPGQHVVFRSSITGQRWPARVLEIWRGHWPAETPERFYAQIWYRMETLLGGHTVLEPASNVVGAEGWEP